MNITSYVTKIIPVNFDWLVEHCEGWDSLNDYVEMKWGIDCILEDLTVEVVGAEQGRILLQVNAREVFPE